MQHMVKIIATVALILFINQNAFAELVFSAPPRGTEEEERATYEPLVSAMSIVIGENIRYEYARGFIEYSFNMQRGVYDLVFDGPHFAQWRVKNLGHTILVNLPENLQFFVITDKNLKRLNPINSLRDLIYETVCAQMTPQLGTLMLVQNYYNGAAEPQMHMVRGEEKVFSDFSEGKCSAAVLRDKRYFKIPEAERSMYKLIYKSAIAPNDAITVDNKISPVQQKALIKLLTNPRAMRIAKPLFDRFSRDAVAFDIADPAKFEGLDQLLLLAFGWDTRGSDSRASEEENTDRSSTDAVAHIAKTPSLR